MNHVYRIERLCLGQTDTTEICDLSEKAVRRAFSALQLGIEQQLGRMPRTVPSVFTLFTQDGLDVRVHSIWDSLTIRNLLASVVSDVNVGNPGLNLSLISKASTGWAPSLEEACRLPLTIPAVNDQLAALHPVGAATNGVVDTERLHLVA